MLCIVLGNTLVRMALLMLLHLLLGLYMNMAMMVSFYGGFCCSFTQVGFSIQKMAKK